MCWHEKLTNLADIPTGKYDGYLWLSDELRPQRISGLITDQYEENGHPKNPFIHEAFLFDNQNQVSVSVKHMAGKYIINTFYLKKIDLNVEIKEICYLAHHSLPGKLMFKEIWIPEEDMLCEDFKVLRKKAVVFIGFKKEEK